MDVVGAAVGLIALAPLLALIALAIKLDDDGPIFFRQTRVGFQGRSFRIMKFRSMKSGNGTSGSLITASGDTRITRLGRWLRRWKLDELPQLVNVLRGEMSLVGPRPEVPYYVARYGARERAVLELVPGITDPASVAYRDEERMLDSFPDPEQAYLKVVMPEKIRLNLEYAERCTVFSDIIILMKTVASVGRGA